MGAGTTRGCFRRQTTHSSHRPRRLAARRCPGGFVYCRVSMGSKRWQRIACGCDAPTELDGTQISVLEIPCVPAQDPTESILFAAQLVIRLHQGTPKRCTLDSPFAVPRGSDLRSYAAAVGWRLADWASGRLLQRSAAHVDTGSGCANAGCDGAAHLHARVSRGRGESADESWGCRYSARGLVC